MKVVFTIAGLHPESGGPSRSVPALCEALAKAGADVEILSLDYGAKRNKALAPGSLPVTLLDCSSLIARQLKWSPQFKARLRETCRANGIQIVHDTGLWLSTNHAAAVVSRELKLPRIVSPRGMLTKWALHHKNWKKQIAFRLYQQRDLRSAQALHATSHQEAEEFRALRLRHPIAVIPNGVALPLAEDRRLTIRDGRKDSEFRTPNSEVRTILFLGRIHPVKGLTNLVRAWASLQKSEVSGQRSAVSGQPQWRVVIAGRDDGGHVGDIKAEIGKLSVENDFEFVGPVEGAAKWDLYRSADLFVLPSNSENFGLVVAEALTCGVPVIASRGTPWEELTTHRCGWWVENRPESLAGALGDAMSRSDEERREMGRRGRDLVEKKYSWPGIAVQMKSVYEWMLGTGPRPECVV